MIIKDIFMYLYFIWFVEKQKSLTDADASSNQSSWMVMANESYIMNIMAADELAIKGSIDIHSTDHALSELSNKRKHQIRLIFNVYFNCVTTPFYSAPPSITYTELRNEHDYCKWHIL